MPRESSTPELSLSILKVLEQQSIHYGKHVLSITGVDHQSIEKWMTQIGKTFNLEPSPASPNLGLA